MKFVYFRLFMGLGLIWYFEILFWALGMEETDYAKVPDIFNMLQGVWVFLTFICKKNVLRVSKNIHI